MTTGVAEKIETNEDERLDMARSLVSHLESGDEDKVKEVLDKLTNVRELQLFQEVGHLTRQLHNSIGDCYNGEVGTVSSKEIRNARERLSYVVEKTEESATRTLNAVEATVPLSEELEASAKQMSKEWERFKRREMNVEDFRALSKKLTVFLETVNVNSSKVHDNLSEVLMAQDYQDLTGQIINQVIKVVEDVEKNLVDLIKCQGLGVCETENDGPDIKAEGPQVNPVDSSKVVSGQDEVDELLSSLGF